MEEKVYREKAVRTIQRKMDGSNILQFVDNRKINSALQGVGEYEENILQGHFKESAQLAENDIKTPQMNEGTTLQQEQNKTGLPDNLKAGIEKLSGFVLDNVRVHYNSNKPRGLQAHAFTQGMSIAISPGQERYLPHEAWHVVQQMAGRVKPTTEVAGMPINDNAELEHEADVMGYKASNYNL